VNDFWSEDEGLGLNLAKFVNKTALEADCRRFDAHVAQNSQIAKIILHLGGSNLSQEENWDIFSLPKNAMIQMSEQ